jgi:hypothetical protein
LSALLNVPPEILDFCERPLPQTMIVKGPSGAGKTTLALTLLSCFPGQRFYVTARVKPEHLRRDFPWTQTPSGGEIQFLDSSREGSSARNDTLSLLRSHELAFSPATSKETPLLLPAPLREIWKLRDPHSPLMIVVDSWDALVERYLGPPGPLEEGIPDRGELERKLIDLASDLMVLLVLVLEREGPSSLDYLVDAILDLDWKETSRGPERFLHLRKLRGTAINTAAYPFTLFEGRFRCVAPIPPHPLVRLVPPELPPNSYPHEVWPGHSQLAEIFGLFPEGLIGLLDAEPDVPPNIIRQFYSPLVSSVLTQGGRVLLISPPQSIPETAWPYFRALMSDEQISQQIRIQFTGGLHDVPPSLEAVVLPSPRSDVAPGFPRTPEAARFIRERVSPKTPNLAITWHSGIRALTAISEAYNPATFPSIVAAYASDAPAHILQIGESGDPFTEAIRPLSGIHIRLRNVAGRIFVHGERPMTPNYALVDGDERLPYQLIRLV